MVINRQMALTKTKLVKTLVSPVVTKRALTVLLTLAAMPMFTALTGCSDSKVSLNADNPLVGTKVTEGDKEPIWPNDDPSIPDGKGVYAAQNCATCHGADGKPVAAKPLSIFPTKVGLASKSRLSSTISSPSVSTKAAVLSIRSCAIN